MTSIVRHAFRKLENYLSSNGVRMRPITYEEERIIRSPMVQCKRWMKKILLDTFY